jgi:glycosyltransferase involved in cell wall biosynthesis
VTLHGFLSKNTEEGRRRLEALMSESHFLIMPSKAECYGLVFAEASSFGLPSLATRTGGIPTAVRDGRNGMTFALDAGPQPYCDYIEALMSSRPDYEALCRSAFLEYAQRLNWGASARQVRTLLQQYCQ